MGLVRYTVDRNATNALRFDDDNFLDALSAADGDFKDLLCRLLGVESGSPVDADLSAFVADGVVIHARASISGRDDARLTTESQAADTRKGPKLDAARAVESQWGAWVVGVSDDDGSVPDALSAHDRKKREEAFGLLPVAVQDAFTARLRVHIRDVSRDALRDPSQTHSRATGKDFRPTSASAAGRSADVQLASD